MDQREHFARQAAGAVDDCIEAHERGEPVSPVDAAIAQASLRAAREAGVHPHEVNQYRRTSPEGA